MKISIFLVLSLIFFSCKKSNESVTKLLRSESTDYNGVLLITEYGYNSDDHIISIKQPENNATPAAEYIITYNGNEITMLSYPKNDPVYNTTKEVHLTMNDNGKPLKEIGYTHSTGSQPYNLSSTKFSYDTLVYMYDAVGFLKETKQSSYDSSSTEPGSTSIGRGNTTISFTTVSGNVTAKDKYTVYTITTLNAGATSLTGGTSEHHFIYNYTKAYPNKKDFRNAAVLNELLDYYEPLLDEKYQNMPEQVLSHTIEKDINGIVSFDYTSTTGIERSYNANGLLSDVNILTPTTPYTKIKYFYGY